MQSITRGLSRKLLAVVLAPRKQTFPAWAPATYRRAFDSQWSYARLASMLERTSLPGTER